jgi:hypothetical protein
MKRNDMRRELVEIQVTVYYDDHNKGHAFFYRAPNSKHIIASHRVYKRLKDCEDTAYKCILQREDERDNMDFDQSKHVTKLSIH